MLSNLISNFGLNITLFRKSRLGAMKLALLGAYEAGKCLLSICGRFAFAFGALHVLDNYLGSTKQVILARVC